MGAGHRQGVVSQEHFISLMWWYQWWTRVIRSAGVRLDNVLIIILIHGNIIINHRDTTTYMLNPGSKTTCRRSPVISEPPVPDGRIATGAV
ncbi:hypothetical protein BDW42DRAFT_169197 [Aspergillus taichungensis]|uniref:Uncharacterized protein n=1 Tax=Aspergillus taichungensis TaxID=482145 RepID=A0A2J5HV99_9EURO|nr:hypothetical protein BDW42DRAFT_169197 [Aspergillus taichungensis]